MLKVIIGEASSGKSTRMIQDMIENSVRDRDRNFIVIVPEQASLSMQKKVVELHPGHATSNINVTSFNYLAHLVFKELKMEKTNILDDTGKALILRKVLDDCKDNLEVYKSKVKMPGFTEEIKSVITELKQYTIDDNILFLMQEKAIENGRKLLFSKLSDIRLIYSRFNEEIKDRFTTAEEVPDIFANIIPRSEILDGAEIFMDGFTGFTPVQYRIISRMLDKAANVTVTITLPEDKIDPVCREHDLFYLSNRTYFKLKEIADDNFETVIQKPDHDRQAKKNRTAFIYEAASPEDEVDFVAGEILENIREKGLRFRDHAVITGDRDTYNTLIKDVFKEAEIACFMDYKSELSDNPLARFVIAALEIVNSGLSLESVLTYLKLGLLDLSLNDINKIENYCLEFGIKGARAWRNEFKKQREDAWDLEEINAIKNVFADSVTDFYRKLNKGEKPANVFVDAIKELLEKNNIKEQIEKRSEMLSLQSELELSGEYDQIYDLVTELLDKISAIMGDEPLSVREFEDILKGGVEEIKVGIAPPSLDNVTVGDITRTRLQDVKVLFLIGVNDGKIPVISAGNGIFTQKERELLKEQNFEIAPTVLENIFTQRFYLHLLLSKPEDGLFLSYAMSNADGTAMLRSYIIDDIEAVCPGLKMKEFTPVHAQTWKYKAMRDLAASIKEPDKELFNYFYREEPDKLDQMLDGAFFTNIEPELDEKTALELYGKIISGSVSRFEKFNECPFKHFMQYGLNIRKRREYEIAAADIGTIYHESLDKYSEKLKDAGKTFRNVEDDESHRLVHESVKEAVEELESDVLESSFRNDFLKKRIEKVTRVTTDVLRDQIVNGKYEPCYFELSFEQHIDDNVRFKGKIDRVDISDEDDVFVKIIDYKSGSKAFDIKDIYTGTQLQLTAYMKGAMEKIAKEFPGKNVRPGGIYYYLINDHFVRTDEDEDKKFMMSGLTNCDEHSLEAIDINMKKNGKSRIVPVSYTKQGDLKGTSQVANDKEFENLMDYVEEIIKDDSERVRRGEVSKKPLYKSEQDNACTYCDYKNVCKFEAGKFGEDYRTIPEELSSDDMRAEIFN